MGKRYYCDYCERSFKDDTEARKRHLSSLQHAKNRADHYSAFGDPETILRQEARKTPCERFMKLGECAFGHGCRFSHYLPEEIRTLLRRETARDGRAGPERYRPDAVAIIEEFFVGAAARGDDADKSLGPAWIVAPESRRYRNLPPSMRLVEPKTITDSNFGKWGTSEGERRRAR